MRCCVALATLGLALSGCGRPGTAPARPAGESVAERGYVSPPAVSTAEAGPGGSVMLAGAAAPTARVRLANPAGEALYAQADSRGTWRLTLPGASGARLLGLSMTLAGRSIQAEGYLAVAPGPLAAQLRAGSGAVALSRPEPGFAILAADYDSKGGAVLSGRAAPGAALTLSVDGTPRGMARADAGGRFMLPLNEPLTSGDHRLELSAGAQRAEVPLTVSPAPRPNPPPFAAAPVAGGWRFDWLTPGGGVQTTILYGGAGR
ncbi:MAG TPA: hypothetical protein VGH15_10850 [Caulobacteraceae bacterium]|jgi:hypothetical protein